VRLAEPFWLLLLLAVPLLWWWDRARPRLAWSSIRLFDGVPANWVSRSRGLPLMLRLAAVGCLVLALARPQVVGGETRIAGKGVAIVVVMDQSSSMKAPDAEGGEVPDPGAPPVTRLEAARSAFVRFVEGRPDDLIGLVTFANYPELACPPTLDHAFLVEVARSVRPARPGDDGTNLGHAVAWGLDALMKASPRKKVLILLTDGRDEPAVEKPLDPQEAARLARDLGVTLHTIAVGGREGAAYKVDPENRPDVMRRTSAPDYALLERMAATAGGRAFVAPDARSLKQVFDTLDALERSPVQATIRVRYDERYGAWAAAGVVLLAADRLLSGGRWRRIP
jgi:Ca-activated chloride channel family protein